MSYLVHQRTKSPLNARGDTLKTLTAEDLKQDPGPQVSVSDEDGDECVAAESDEEIVDETLRQSPMKNSTSSKSRKVVVPEPLQLSYSEDEEHRPSPSTRNRASPAPLRAGGNARYFRRCSNLFSNIASKKLAARKAKDGGRK